MSDPRIEIPSFRPWGLEEVPNGHDWFEWRKNVTEARVEVGDLTTFGDEQTSAEFYQQAELQLCSEDPARWIAFWLYVEEPRVIKGEEPIKPFVPFAFQVELAQWFVRRTAEEDAFDGFVSKSRGLGASWIFAAMAVWSWLFRPWRGVLVSRNEKLVDNRGDLNSLFGKIDFILDHLPEWMLPEGFEPEVHRRKNLLIHPVHNNRQIVGEATTGKATRGARATFIIYDEAAFIPDFVHVFGTGSGTSNHRWCVSSESFEEGDWWWLTWHAAQERDPDAVRELDYWLNPYFDDEWFEAEKTRWSHDPEGFSREYLRNPYEGSSWIYPEVRAIKHFEEPRFDGSFYDESQLLLVGIDPGRADDTAIVFMQFDGYDADRTARWIDSYSCNRQPAEYYAHILTGIPPEPEDPLYYTEFDTYATEVIMPWMRSLPWTDAMRVFCDPAGNAKDGTGKSFVERIVYESKRLRQREFEKNPDSNRKPVAIVPLYEELFSANRHDKRRLELRNILLRSEFANTPGARRLKNALENYRFQESTGKQTSERSPLHDAYSHLSTAAEYVAVYCSIGLGRVKPKRERTSKYYTDPLTGQKRRTR